MSNRKSRLWMIMFVALCVALWGMTASAATPAATIGKKQYKSLQAALNAVKNGQTIKLKKNIKVTEGQMIDFTRNVKFTLDLNKHTVANVVGYGFHIKKGTVTIKNGTIKAGAPWKEGYSGGFSVYIEKGARLNITDGTYKNLNLINYGTAVFSGGKYTFDYTYSGFANYGTMTLGKIEASSTGCGGNDAIVKNLKGGKLSIKSGKYRAKLHETGAGDKSGAMAVVYNQEGSTIISGGTFTTSGGDNGYSTSCLWYCNGSLKITKATCKSCRPCIMQVYDYNYLGINGELTGKLTIDGGDFTTTDADASTLSINGTVKINGGTIKATAKGSDASAEDLKQEPHVVFGPYALSGGKRARVTMTGGTFSCPGKHGVKAEVRLLSGGRFVNKTARKYGIYRLETE